jgi:hypothetical protein
MKVSVSFVVGVVAKTILPEIALLLWCLRWPLLLRKNGIFLISNMEIPHVDSDSKWRRKSRRFK